MLAMEVEGGAWFVVTEGEGWEFRAQPALQSRRTTNKGRVMDISLRIDSKGYRKSAGNAKKVQLSGPDIVFEIGLSSSF
jgi:hypothetical protein